MINHVDKLKPNDENELKKIASKFTEAGFFVNYAG
jgi:hypothetical protein